MTVREQNTIKLANAIMNGYRGNAKVEVKCKTKTSTYFSNLERVSAGQSFIADTAMLEDACKIIENNYEVIAMSLDDNVIVKHTEYVG